MNNQHDKQCGFENIFHSIPSDWGLVTMGEISDIKTGGNAPQGEKYFHDGKYPFVRVQHFDGDHKYVTRWDLINDIAIKDYKLIMYPRGSILFPKSGASVYLEKRAIEPVHDSRPI